MRGLNKSLEALENNKIRVHVYLQVLRDSDEAKSIPDITVPAIPQFLMPCE